MSSFSITARAPYPTPTQPFSGGVQFQVNGTDVGPVGPAILNIQGANVTGTYNPTTGAVTITFGTG